MILNFKEKLGALLSDRRYFIRAVLICLISSVSYGCADKNSFTSQNIIPDKNSAKYEYMLGPGDVLNVFVWRNPELSIDGIPVRPDGKISTPLVEGLDAAGKSPQQLARDIEQRLARFIKDPFVTVTVMTFLGRLSDQIRVVGEAGSPRALPYRSNMTLLDVMIAVGGLTEFAAGDRASIVRRSGSKQIQIPVKIKSLLKDGDINANVGMLPGDILIIPESWF